MFFDLDPKMSLQEYIKKHSKIPAAFVDDFHSVYDRASTEKYVVDLDRVAEWLNTQKGALKKTLLKSYNNGIDYVITKDVNKGVGRKPEKITMTADCFKMLCMGSKTAKGDVVRKYYVEIGNLTSRYLNELADRLRTLELNDDVVRRHHL